MSISRLEEEVTAVWESNDDVCWDCQYYVYGTGGPDPQECKLLNGDVNEGLEECPGLIA